MRLNNKLGYYVITLFVVFFSDMYTCSWLLGFWHKSIFISSLSTTVWIKWEIPLIENLLPKKFGPQTWFINICFPQMHIEVIRTWWIGRLDFSLKLHCKKNRQFDWNILNKKKKNFTSIGYCYFLSAMNKIKFFYF